MYVNTNISVRPNGIPKVVCEDCGWKIPLASVVNGNMRVHGPVSVWSWTGFILGVISFVAFRYLWHMNTTSVIVGVVLALLGVGIGIAIKSVKTRARILEDARQLNKVE